MARLRPRIGKQNEHAVEGCVRQGLDDFPRVALMDAGVFSFVGRQGIEFRKQFRNARLVWLGADETDCRMMLRLPEQVLAATEADLEPNVLDHAVKIGMRIAVP